MKKIYIFGIILLILLLFLLFWFFFFSKPSCNQNIPKDLRGYIQQAIDKHDPNWGFGPSTKTPQYLCPGVTLKVSDYSDLKYNSLVFIDRIDKPTKYCLSDYDSIFVRTEFTSTKPLKFGCDCDENIDCRCSFSEFGVDKSHETITSSCD